MPVKRLYTWLQQLWKRNRRPQSATAKFYARLHCEVLEYRDCPAEVGTSSGSIPVTSFSGSRPIPITGPTTITQPGVYQLQNDIRVSSGVAIQVAASDVVIDLNGHSLIGPGTANNTSIGIWAWNQDRITIRNGTVDNFFYGIYLSDSADYVVARGGYFDQGGHIIENVRFYGNTFRALRVEGVANVIRNNVFSDTGGSRVYKPTYSAAIETYGPGSVIEDNLIYNIRGSGYGILVSNLGAGTVIKSNIVTAAAVAPTPGYSATVEGLHANAITFAIAVKGWTTNAIVTANTIANYDYGIAFLSAARGLISGNTLEETLVPFFAPSGAGPVVLAPDNIADRLNYILASSDGLVRGSGNAVVSPAPLRSVAWSASVPGKGVRTITSPTVISQPGYYRLASDLRVSSGIAIQINANDVYLDLSGHTLIGPGTASNTAIGIYASGRSRIHIGNGSISGFQYGIFFADDADAVHAGTAYFDSGGHIVENVRLYANTFRAIRIEGRGNVVRDNVVEDTGGSNLYNPPFAAGIEVLGPGNFVLHNHVYALRGQGAAIYVGQFGSGTIVQDNTIAQAALNPSSSYPTAVEGLLNWAITWGIRVDSHGAPSLVNRNTVANFVYGIAFPTLPAGLISSNIVTGSFVPYFAAGTSVYFAATNISDSGGGLITSDPGYGAGVRSSPSPGRNVVRPATGDVYFIRGPITITAPGTYILQQDIIYTGSGAAITIATSNVTIDLNGFQIVGPGTANNTAIGIASRNQDQITIRNGTIRGFMYGIYLSDDSDVALSGGGFNQGRHVVENMQLIGNTFRGIRIEGRGNIIRNNIIEDTGGTSVYRNPFVMAVESFGPGALIENNYIYAVRGNGYGIGISGDGGGTIVRGNKLSNSSRTPSWSYRPTTDGVITDGNTYGIYIGDGNGEVIALDNQIINYAVGVAWHANSGGVIAGNAVTQSSVAYYTPGRPNPLIFFAPNNSMDPNQTVVTVEQNILPNTTYRPPPLYQAIGPARRSVIPIYGPTVITRPGIYVLQSNISIPEGVAIQIQASDVILDLNGHSIVGPGTPNTQAIGIYASNVDRIRIRNGTIRGFMYGILVGADGGIQGGNRVPFSHGGHIIENLRLINNRFRGIRAEGRGIIIRNNFVANTGGSTVYPKSYAFGIEIVGPGAFVRGNTVYNSFGRAPQGEGVGISISTVGGGSIVENNIVANSSLLPTRAFAPWPGNSTSTWGIWAGDSASGFLELNQTTVLLVDNVVSNARYGLAIHPMSRGLMSGNVAAGSVVPFYTPIRTRLFSFADTTNQADKEPAVYTVGRNY